MIFAAVVPSAALSEHLPTAGSWQSLKAPWVQHLWSTWQHVHNCVCLQGTTPEKAGHNSRLWVKPAFIRRLCSFIFLKHMVSQLLRSEKKTNKNKILHKFSESSPSNHLKSTKAECGTILQHRWGRTFIFLRCCLTMSLLSMPTFLRLAATEPMSFSESQDLKSFTAKHGETPE